MDINKPVHIMQQIVNFLIKDFAMRILIAAQQTISGMIPQIYALIVNIDHIFSMPCY